MTQAKPSLSDIFQTENEEPNPASEAPLERTPSWFHQPAPDSVGAAFNARYAARKPDESLMIETPGPEKYEAFQRRMDSRFAEGQRFFDPEKPTSAEKRPTLPLSDIHGRRRLYQDEQNAFDHESQKMEARPFPIFKMVSLGLIAMLVGGGSGFVFANRDQVFDAVNSKLAVVQASIGQILPAAKETAVQDNVTVLPKKAIAIASLNVSDARGNLNSNIPLQLDASVVAGQEPVDLKVSGLPPDSYLTKGIEITKGNWLLKPDELAAVSLVVPQTAPSQFDVQVAAVEHGTGILAAPVKALTVEIADAKVDQKADVGIAVPADLAATIAPATGAAEISTQAAKIPLPDTANPEAAALISKGDALLNTGDVASARQYYLQAFALGDANGAYGAGRTYDPKIYAALNVQDLQADAGKAKEWYKKAISGGSAAARIALETLQAAN